AIFAHLSGKNPAADAESGCFRWIVWSLNTSTYIRFACRQVMLAVRSGQNAVYSALASSYSLIGTAAYGDEESVITTGVMMLPIKAGLYSILAFTASPSLGGLSLHQGWRMR
ncbi:MAG: hypothetical protein LBC69_02325, partial [Eubacteriaceae bacterium]|nr:hypothetical protein [Eubacteriaceae bacterium]